MASFELLPNQTAWHNLSPQQIFKMIAMMKNILLLSFFLAVAVGCHPVTAQQLKGFQLVNVVNNQSVSSDSYSSARGMVLIFTSNSCPYDEYYRTRIYQLAQSYEGRLPVILVNSHTEPQESLQQMAEKAKELKLTVPYLADKSQTLMSSLEVRKSPEAFLLNNDNGKFSVVYRGAIDDNPQVAGDVRHHYLRDAMEKLLTRANIETPQVRPVGCNVKKK